MSVRVVETRPSGASRWTKCSAAPLFASRSPVPPDSDPAREGTCAAWVGDLVLKGQAFRAIDLLGEFHANGWEVDLEMCGHVQNYVDMVHADGGMISTERFVRLSDHVAGTLDNSASHLSGIVKVRDLKYGFMLVEADAEQLVIYAGALVAEMMNEGIPVRGIQTEIYQPRGYHAQGIHRIKTWTVGEIFERCKWIAERAELCHLPNPVATVGTHCTNCDGASGCAALAATTATIITSIESDQFREMTSDELAQRLSFIRHAKKVIDAAANAVETEALTRFSSGERLTGWGQKERFGRKKFNRTAGDIQALTGIDPYKKVLMSPAELKASGASDMMIDLLAFTPSIGHKLTPLDASDLAREFPKGTPNHG